MTRKATYTAIIFMLVVCLWPISSMGQDVKCSSVLDQTEWGWEDFGLVFRAEADVLLVSVHYPNQGLADVVELRLYSDGTLLTSVPVPAGNPDATVEINYPLTKGETYELVSTTSNNRYWAYFSQLPVTNSEITVLSSYGNSYTFFYFWFAFDVVTTGSLELAVQGITIDIKPGSDQNIINLKSKGVVTVAILTTEQFDAYTVDPESVVFAGALPEKYSAEDVDNDGDVDVVFHFKTQNLSGLDENSTEASLTGLTLDDIPVEGTDTVRIVPKKK